MNRVVQEVSLPKTPSGCRGPRKESIFRHPQSVLSILLGHIRLWRVLIPRHSSAGRFWIGNPTCGMSLNRTLWSVRRPECELPSLGAVSIFLLIPWKERTGGVFGRHSLILPASLTEKLPSGVVAVYWPNARGRTPQAECRRAQARTNGLSVNVEPTLSLRCCGARNAPFPCELRVRDAERLPVPYAAVVRSGEWR